MANPTIEQADIHRVLGYVLRLLGIADPNYPTTPRPYAGAPWTKQQILDLIIQADVEVRVWIAETLNHPLRNSLLWAVSAALTDGAQVPPSQSGYRYVRITNDGVTRDGKLADDFEQLMRWKESPAVYGDFRHFYIIHNGHIHFSHANSIATMSLADIKADRAANSNEGAISAPLRYEWAVVANTLKMTYQHGQDPANRRFYADLAMGYEQEVKQGKMSLTVPEVFQKLKT